MLSLAAIEQAFLQVGKNGGEVQVDHELDLADLDAMLANRTAAIDAVTARKAAL